MSFPSLSAEDMAKLVTACEGDQDTLATIEAFCSSKTDVEVREVRMRYHVLAKSIAV